MVKNMVLRKASPNVPFPYQLCRVRRVLPGYQSNGCWPRRFGGLSSRFATRPSLHHGSTTILRGFDGLLSSSKPRSRPSVEPRLRICPPSRNFRAGPITRMETQVEPESSPEVSTASEKILHTRSTTRKELRKWQTRYDQDQAHLLEASFHGQENGSDFIRELRNQFFMPPRYIPMGELPANFRGEKTRTLARDSRIPQVGDVYIYLEEGIPNCAVLVRRWNNEVDFYYNIDGKYVELRQNSPNGVFFPGRIDPEDILPILPYLPPAEDERRYANSEAPNIPGSAGMQLRRCLARIRDEVQDTINGHFERLSSLWNIVAHEDEARVMSLEDLAAVAFNISRNELTMAQAGALYCYLLQSAGPFAAMRPKLTLLTDTDFGVAFGILSRQDKALIQQVMNWYQIYHSASNQQQRDATVFGRFVKYARALIKDSRSQRHPMLTGTLGPYGKSLVEDAHLNIAGELDVTSTKRSSDAWPSNTDEATMLSYLKRVHVLKERIWRSFVESEGNIIPAMMRATGMYPDCNLSPTLFRLFLRELGLLTPWEETERMVSKPFLKNAYDDHNLNALIDEAAADFGDRSDLLQHIRHDWGDMEVFCVDSATTRIVDDGFSVESVPGEQTSHWVHVHIANPTACMELNDPIAVAARERVTSVYAIGYYQAMLPEMVSQRYSLEADRPTLTFSAKIHENGEILEKKITPGYIRNVTRVTPSAMQRLLYPTAAMEASTTTFIVGDRDLAANATEHELRTGDDLDQPQTAALLQLRQLAKALQARWGQTNIDVYNPRYASASLYVMGLDALKLTQDRPFRPSADPTIVFRSSVAITKHGSEYIRTDEGDRITKIFMQLASHIAADYCTDRNIPVMFQRSIQDPALPDYHRYYHEFFENIPMDRPLVRDLAIRSVATRRGTIVMRPTPDKDDDSLSRVPLTSPLRRYSDMFTHFQIQRSLLLEANGLGSKIQFEHNDPRLPCSHDQLETFVPRIERVQSLWFQHQNFLQRRWTQEFINRALRFGEDPSFPKYVEVIVVESRALSTETVKVMCPLLATPFLMEHDHPFAPAEGFLVGERWLAMFSMRPQNPVEQLQPIARLGREYPDGYKPMDDLRSDLPDFTTFEALGT